MNYTLAKEIYGNTVWHVDECTLSGLLGVLNAIQNGVKLDIPDIKYNSAEILINSSEGRLIRSSWDLNNSDDFEGVGIINLDGPITVNGGMSSYGVNHLSSQMLEMSKDKRIKSFIMLGDSGGGASAAVEIMSDTINEIKKTKPVYGLVKKGGTLASAAFGIFTACNYIYAESEMSVVGSLGTMANFMGRKANSTDANGIKEVRVYAPESEQKNKWYEEALNNDNYTILKNEILKPLNDNFLTLCSENRPALLGSDFRNANTKFAKNSIGTYIDGIKSFAQVVNLALGNKEEKQVEKKNEKKTNNNLIKTNSMNLLEIKQKHPLVYAEIVAVGVSQEKDRTGAWMAHSATDLPAVKSGIDSGLEISATARENFLVKGANLNHLANIKKDSKEELPVPEAKTKKVVLDNQSELDSVANMYNDMDEELGLTSKND